MSNTIWTNGAATRDLNTAGNWSGGVPISNDNAYFLSDYTGTNTGPNASMAALNLVDLDLLYIGEGFTEDIGGSSNDIDVSADHVWHRGAGKLWYKDGAGTTDLVTIDSTAASPTTSIANITAATVTRLQVLRGGVTVDGSGTVTNIDVGQRSSAATDANLTVSPGATITNIEQYAGIANCSAAIATARLIGGRLTQDTATITTLYVFGGTCVFNFAGTITGVYHYGGTIDVTQSGGQKTFTNYYKAPGARLIGENSGLLSIGTRWDVSNE